MDSFGVLELVAAESVTDGVRKLVSVGTFVGDTVGDDVNVFDSD